ncbi:MAG: SGNH/GDSL hydrolase family protein [Thermodesulfobacteriota bacterium]
MSRATAARPKKKAARKKGAEGGRTGNIPAPKKNRGPWRFVVPAAVVLAMLVFADLFVMHRIFGAPDRATFLMGFYGDPGTRLEDTAINRMGFTGDVLRPKKPPGVIRVLTLGGSVLFNRRFAEKLKRAISEKITEPVEVLGGALRVHNTWSSREKLAFLSRYHFDFVVICHGINDLDANSVAPEDFREDYSQLNPWHHRGFWVEHSTILRLLYNRFLYSYPDKKEPKDCISAPVFARNMERLVDMARDSGATPILMTFAWVIPGGYTLERFKKGRAGYVNPDNYDPCPVELWGRPPYVNRCLEENNRAVRDLAARKNVPLLDAESLLGKDPRLFGDLCHPNNRGVDLLVSGIAGKIAELREGGTQETQ